MSKPITIPKYPDYKGNYKGKLLQPILKHSKVHRPKSKWIIKLLWDDLLSKGFSMIVFQGVAVQDISIGLENPLNLVPPFVPFENDIMGAWGKDMEKQWYDNMKSVKEEDFGGLFDDKPSLLTRVKNRLKK